MAGDWDVPSGTKSKLKIKNKDWAVNGGAIEHKNRPEALYATFTSWVKPKLTLIKAKANSTPDPQELVVKIAIDFNQEVLRAGKKASSCFDSKYFDLSSLIWIVDYSPETAVVGQRQRMDIEINIDTVNTIDNNNQPSPNPATGKVEMYSYKDLEKYLAAGIDKCLGLETFNQNKALATFSTSKGAK